MRAMAAVRHISTLDNAELQYMSQFGKYVHPQGTRPLAAAPPDPRLPISSAISPPRAATNH
jgi:hypothetical protein